MHMLVFFGHLLGMVHAQKFGLHVKEQSVDEQAKFCYVSSSNWWQRKRAQKASYFTTVLQTSAKLDTVQIKMWFVCELCGETIENYL